MSRRKAPIGVFDSGVGGLSVLRHLHAHLPHQNFIYVADQAHVPYGCRPLKEIRQLSENVVRFLLTKDAKMIVIACNTASGAALNSLRRTFPSLPFVGMEPAVKPAAAQTKSDKVGVLATTGTFESQRYAALMQRFAVGVTVFESPCSGLVELIEAGQVDGDETEQLLRHCVEPMMATGVDSIVLGCTHYPFIRPLLEKICGSTINIIDPAPAITRQTARLLLENGMSGEGNGRFDTVQCKRLSFYTSGNPTRMTAQVRHLLADDTLPLANKWEI